MAQDVEQTKLSEAEARPAARWRRFVAFIVDSLIVGLPAMIVGIMYFDAAASLGEWGRLVGITLTLLYFGFFDSGLGGGRSPGKRLFHLKVVGQDAVPLSPAPAMLRTAILLTPFYLNGFPFDESTSPLLLGLMALLVLGLLFSTLYLFIFNPSRRSLHDLLTGAVVIDTRDTQLPILGPVWAGHWVVVGALCLGSIVLALSSPRLETAMDPKIRELPAIRRSIMSLPVVSTAEVGMHWRTIASLRTGTTHSEALVVVAKLRVAPTSVDTIRRQVEDAIFAEHSEAIGETRVVIVLRYGFTFGALANVNRNFVEATSAAEWRMKTRQIQL